jgi:hypothetical protein
LLEAKTDLVHNHAFNIGANKENYQVSHLAEIVREVVPRSVVEYASDADPDPRSYRVDFSKLLLTFPNFRPKWTATAGARELVAAFKEVGLTLEAFESPRFTRLKHLKLLLGRGRLDDELRWQSDRGIQDRGPQAEPRASARAR